MKSIIYLTTIALAVGMTQGAEQDGWKMQGKGGPKKMAEQGHKQAVKAEEQVELGKLKYQYVPGGIPVSEENKKKLTEEVQNTKKAQVKVQQTKAALDKHAGSSQKDMRQKISLSLQEKKINLDKIEAGGHIFGTPGRDANKSYFVNEAGAPVKKDKLAGFLQDLLNKSDMGEPEIVNTEHDGNEKKLVILTPRVNRVTGRQQHEDYHKVTILWDATHGVWNAYPSN